MIWDVKALREKLAEAAAKCEAIFETAKAEQRDLTADESAEVDRIQGTGDRPGEIQAIQAQIARAERFDSIKAGAAISRLGGNVRLEEKPDDGPPQQLIKVPANAKRSTKLKAFRGPNAMEDAYLSGQFLLATLGNNEKAKQWCKDNGVQMIMNTDENGKGGYLVPDPLENTLIDLKEEYGSFRQYAMPWPMASETTSVPRRVSGFTTYFPGQGKDISLSDMAFDQVKLAAKKLACLTRITSELNEDTIISLADVIAREMAYALAVTEDDCGWLGDGTSTYGGIKGVANALAAGSIVTATGVTTFANVTRSHFQTVVGKLPDFRGIQPAWYFNKAAYWATAANLQLAAGGNAVADLGSGPVLQFMGYPVRLIENLPGTEGSGVKFAYFGDLAMTATMGNRRGVEIRSDSSVGFVSDTIYIRCTERFDINVHEVGTASAAGPLVMLQLG